MYEVSEPLLGVLVAVCGVRRHVERPLADERLRGRRHVLEVVHHHEHLDDGAERVEQGRLDRALLGDAVPLLAQVDVTLDRGEIKK